MSIRSHFRMVVLSAGLALPLHSASAHPKLISSTPTASSTVAGAPDAISVTFNEAVTTALSKLVLLDASSQIVPLDSLVALESDNKTLIAKIGTTLKAGQYTVKWQAAGGDGHPMRGEFAFIVAEPPKG